MTDDRRIDGTLPVAFRYTPGLGNGAFFASLRDEGTFVGSRCSSCDVTYLPARVFCERCLAELRPDTTCGPGGTLTSWTTLHVDVDDEPLPAPERYGLVRLDGADTVLLHRLLPEDGWDPAIGDRVVPVLRSDREGRIGDLEGFSRAAG
ncbi:MAG TPA: zinc ribbon domain-containing protein [Actinomycetota bacterium]|jgi:uncharacterized OB-fold protein